MFERYPSKKNVDVAYQGDFEDAAWTKFSEGQLPPTRITLKDFADNPFVPGEITSKSEYVRHVITWFSKALVDAGYKSEDVDGLIQRSFDVIDFNRPAEAYVADINRIIQDFYKNAPGTGGVSPEQLSPAAEAQPQAPVVNTPTPVTSTVAQSTSQSINQNSVAVLTEKSDAFNLREETEFDDRAAEFREYGSRRIEPVIPTPEAVVAAPVMPIIEANEPIVLETTPDAEAAENPAEKIVSEYQQRLDALNEQPFDRDKYEELVFSIFPVSRDAYDTVLKNPKLYDKKIFAPSDNEKAAILLRGRMQKHHSRMRLLTETVMNCLNNTTETFNEAELKFLVAKFIAHSDKLIEEASELSQLYELIKTEEKPSVAETYRAQFEKMQVEGNQVLQSLASDHPLYDRLKTAIESDLQTIISEASPERGGDKAVLENSSSFMARRDQIKNLIAFVKQEQELQDFFARAQGRVQKLESDFESIPASTQSERIKKQLAENIVKVKQVLAETTSQVATVGVLENLRAKKDIIQGLLLESQELIKTVPVLQTESSETAVNLVPAEVLLAKIKEKIQREPLVYIIPPQFISQFEQHIAQEKERVRKFLETPTLYERVKKLAAKISPGTITKAAALVLASALPLGQENKQTGNPMLAGSLVPTSLLSRQNIDYPAIADYLKTVATVEAIENSKAPVVPETVPGLPTTPEEIIPGVTLLPDDISLPDITVNDNPLEIYSDNADIVPSDPGIVFESPKNNDVPEVLRKPYTINIGDNFWDINEGQTIAGKLPVLGQINPYFKQALIDRVRDRINTDEKLRDAIGGIGKTADQLIAGKLMNLDKLNELAVNVAIEYGYLK